MRSTEVEALVVGAGPTGLLAAAELARHGVAIRIVDRAEHGSRVSKAIAVQPRTLELLDLLGLADRAVEHGLAIDGIELFSNGRRLAGIDVRAEDTRYGHIVTIPQDRTEGILADHLAELAGRVEWRTELRSFTDAAHGVEAVLDGPAGEERVRAAWLLGCDGAHSAVRAGLGVGFEGESLPELWSLIEAPLDWDFGQSRARMFLGRRGTVATFPLKGGVWRLMADRPDARGDEQLPDPTPTDFERLARERGIPLRAVGDPVWSGYFRIAERLATSYRTGRVFLCGDAAHVHSPAGGQGMNTGLQDVHNLAWKIALVHAGRASESLLDSYEAERRPVAEGVLRLSGLMLRSATSRNPAVEAARRVVPKLLQGLPGLARRVAALVGQTSIDYGESPIVSSSPGRRLRPGPGPAAGRRALDAGGLRLDGRSARMFDMLRGTRHVLFLFPGGDGPAGMDAAVRTAHRRGDAVESWLVVPPEARRTAQGAPSGRPRARVLVDHDGEAAAAYGADEPRAYLVRPDGYVAYRGDGDPARLEAAIAKAIP